MVGRTSRYGATLQHDRTCASATASCFGEVRIGDDARVAKTGHVSGAMIETQSPAVGKRILSELMWRT